MYDVLRLFRDHERNVRPMNNETPMRILLVEDDASACGRFMDCANNRSDVVFVAMTSHSSEGIAHVKNKLPEAVILDMELNWGKGSGLDFLRDLQALDLNPRPLVVVTTRSRSEVVQEMIHEYGVEWIFCKKQEGYSPEMVLNQLITMRPYLYSVRGDQHVNLETLETPEERDKRIMQRIVAELNAIGIRPNPKGRKLAEEAIFDLVKRKDANEADTVIQDLADKHNTRYNNVLRNIQTVIETAWKTGDIEMLEKHYTAPIRPKLGVPSPTEFIHYYADKIRGSM